MTRLKWRFAQQPTITPQLVAGALRGIYASSTETGVEPKRRLSNVVISRLKKSVLNKIKSEYLYGRKAMKTANISFRKTIVCAIACIILSAVIMVQVSADHYSSWEYLINGPMPYYYNYGSRSYGVLTSTGFYSRGEINYPGYTYNIITIDEVTLVYANNFSNTYVDDWYYNDFPDEFDLDFLPAQQYCNVTSLEAPEIPLYTGVTLMHSIALTTAVFSDFVFDPDYGDYNRWYIDTTSHQIHSINHNPSLCEICIYYGN